MNDAVPIVPRRTGAHPRWSKRSRRGLIPGVARLAAIAILAGVAGGCVTTGGGAQVASLAPGQRPAVESDEAGLWMITDKLERTLLSSGRVETDPGLNDYLRRLVCRIAPGRCGEIRLHIVNTPHFNASMAPNGSMQVWTGLLLRARNEAQLAYVLGHEIGHYLRRHTVQQWRDVRTKTSVLTFMQFATAAAGVGYVGSLAELAAIGSILQFSREHEREADDIGFEMMVKAGYDPGEAVKIWEALDAERRAGGDSDDLIFFSTHPSSAERIATLRTRAAAARARTAGSGVTGRDAYRSATAPFLMRWLRGEIQNRTFARTEVLLERLRSDDRDEATVRFYSGELHRLRGEEGDDESAVEMYRAALASGSAPVETYRSLGVVEWRLKRSAAARVAFQGYLDAAPDAPDREMIISYIERLRREEAP